MSHLVCKVCHQETSLRLDGMCERCFLNDKITTLTTRLVEVEGERDTLRDERDEWQRAHESGMRHDRDLLNQQDIELASLRSQITSVQSQWDAHKRETGLLIEQLESITRERDAAENAARAANNHLFEAECDPSEVEHVIECHSDQLPEHFRALAKHTQAALDALQESTTPP